MHSFHILICIYAFFFNGVIFVELHYIQLDQIDLLHKNRTQHFYLIVWLKYVKT